jgi:hypothetical protein
LFDLRSVAKMAVEYRIALRNEGWMIEREGQLYGPYGSKQEALSEAVYVANYSISHGLQAEVIVQKYLGNLDRFIPALRTIIPHLGAS